MSGSLKGEEITYPPLAHLPRSIRRHRSLQNGNSASVFNTIFRQVGQRRLTALFVINQLLGPTHRSGCPILLARFWREGGSFHQCE